MEKTALLEHLYAEACKALKFAEECNFEDEVAYWNGAHTALVQTIAHIEGIGFQEVNFRVYDMLEG